MCCVGDGSRDFPQVLGFYFSQVVLPRSSLLFFQKRVIVSNNLLLKVVPQMLTPL